MRVASLRSFLAQAHALVHAEPVLLVDNHERKLPECHFLLEQRMRTDGDRGSALGECGLCVAAGARRQAAREEERLEAEWREPAREILRMLLGKQFGRRHQRGLGAGLGNIRGRKCGDDGLAGADVALDEAQHRMRDRKVTADLAA